MLEEGRGKREEEEEAYCKTDNINFGLRTNIEEICVRVEFGAPEIAYHLIIRGTL